MRIKKLANLVSIPLVAGFLSGCFGPFDDSIYKKYDSAGNYALIVADKSGDNDGVTTMQEKVKMWVGMGLHVEEVPDYKGGTYFKCIEELTLNEWVRRYEQYIMDKGYIIEYDKKGIINGIEEKPGSFRGKPGIYK